MSQGTGPAQRLGCAPRTGTTAGPGTQPAASGEQSGTDVKMGEESWGCSHLPHLGAITRLREMASHPAEVSYGCLCPLPHHRSHPASCVSSRIGSRPAPTESCVPAHVCQYLCRHACQHRTTPRVCNSCAGVHANPAPRNTCAGVHSDAAPCTHAHASRAPCNAHARPQDGDEGSHHRAARAASRWAPGRPLPLPALPAGPRRPGATLPNPRAAEPGPRLRLRCPGRPGLGLAVGLRLPASPWDAGHAASPAAAASPQPEQRLLPAAAGWGEHSLFPTLAAALLGNRPATPALGSQLPRGWSPFSSLLPPAVPVPSSPAQD